LLLVGAPDFDSDTVVAGASAAAPVAAEQAAGGHRRSSCADFRTLSFPPLPGSGREAAGILQIWKDSPDLPEGAGVHYLSGPAANEAAFKRMAPDHRVLHLATHGFFLGESCPSAGGRGIGSLAPAKQPALPPSGENPLLLSGLVLAGANRRAQAADDDEDGILTAEEIATLDLSRVEWAVLSACDTGAGTVKAGEGVFGLRRAFQIAGVGTVIMSLWSVGDEPTVHWMKALYEERLLRGLDTAAAVRAATRRILDQRREGGESTHPFFWAGFVAAGDWR
jgi:CHAT domain-containing protein